MTCIAISSFPILNRREPPTKNIKSCVDAVAQCIRCLPHVHKVMSSNPHHGMEGRKEGRYGKCSPLRQVLAAIEG